MFKLLKCSLNSFFTLVFSVCVFLLKKKSRFLGLQRFGLNCLHIIFYLYYSKASQELICPKKSSYLVTFLVLYKSNFFSTGYGQVYLNLRIFAKYVHTLYSIIYLCIMCIATILSNWRLNIVYIYLKDRVECNRVSKFCSLSKASSFIRFLF